jgi:FkbM family methyltransferase
MLIPQLKYWAKTLLKQDYRAAYQHRIELERIKNTPRYAPMTTNILGTPLAIVDSISFYYSYAEIFKQEIYAFKTNQPRPIIIDGGSNIGLSVIYFKQLYADSRILAFEADPQVFQVLTANVQNFGYGDVQLFNQALWTSTGTIEFDSEGADAGRVSPDHRDRDEQINQAQPPIADSIEMATQKITVSSARLRDYQILRGHIASGLLHQAIQICQA